MYEAAKAAHPERWGSRATRDWSKITEVHLNPDKTVSDKPEGIDSTETMAS